MLFVMSIDRLAASAEKTYLSTRYACVVGTAGALEGADGRRATGSENHTWKVLPWPLPPQMPRMSGTLIFGRSMKFLATWMESLSRNAGLM